MEEIIEKFYEDYAKSKINYAKHQAEREAYLLSTFLICFSIIFIFLWWVMSVGIILTSDEDYSIIFPVGFTGVCIGFSLSLKADENSLKKKSPKDWLMEELRRFDIIRDIFFYNRMNFEWSNMKSVNLKVDEKRVNYKDRMYDYYYYLIIDYKSKTIPKELFLGKNRDKEVVDIIRDLFD